MLMKKDNKIKTVDELLVKKYENMGWKEIVKTQPKEVKKTKKEVE